MSPVQIGVIGLVVLVITLLSNMPVAVAMGLVGVVGFAIVTTPLAAVNMMTSDLYDIFSAHTLTVIPLFIMMGQVCFHAGISRKLFDAAYKCIGALPGGLAMATVWACAAFGAICGSGPATTATIGAVSLPEMKRYGYSQELAGGTVASGGTLGMLIPPSIVFIVYGVMTELSIGDLYAAGVVPGIMISAMFCVTIYIWCILHPASGPAGPRTTLGEKLRSLLGVFDTLLLFLVVIGGMFTGFFTATEAAAVGVFMSIVLAVMRQQFSWKIFLVTLRETVRMSCMVMLIVAGAVMFGRFIAITEIPTLLAGWLTTLPYPPWVVMSFIIFFYLVAGCFLDALAIVLLTVQIFAPVASKLGFDLIWFGVMIVVVTQMGTISPPVGICSYVVSGVDRSDSAAQGLHWDCAVLDHPHHRGRHSRGLPTDRHVAADRVQSSLGSNALRHITTMRVRAEDPLHSPPHGSGLQPSVVVADPVSWGVAPGWYLDAPLALNGAKIGPQAVHQAHLTRQACPGGRCTQPPAAAVAVSVNRRSCRPSPWVPAPSAPRPCSRARSRCTS